MILNDSLSDSFDFYIEHVYLNTVAVMFDISTEKKAFLGHGRVKKMDMFLTGPLTFASIIVHYDDTVFFFNSSCSCHKTIFPFLSFKVWCCKFM